MSNKAKYIIRLCINLLMFVMVTITICSNFFTLSNNESNLLGFACFKYFTILSNALAGLFALATFIILIINKNEEFVHTFYLFKYISCVSVLLTFTVVIFFLGPTQGYYNMFKGTGIFVHLLVPILAAIDFVTIKHDECINICETLLPIVPTFLYSIVYLVMVAILNIWEDFYGLLFGGNYFLAPLSVVIMYLATFGLSVIIKFLATKYNKTKVKSS